MTTSHILEENIKRELLYAFNEARKRKLSTANEFKFEINLSENLTQLRYDILSRQYRPSRGVAFINEYPVIREIFAAPFRDRIVHHYIVNHIEPWWDHRFINDSYSCRKGRGTDFGLRRLYHFMRKVFQNFTKPTYVVKFDIKSYFTSLPQDRLYKRAIWGLERQYLYPGHTFYDAELFDLLSFLWREIIFDDPTSNVTIRGEKELWYRLPAPKSLFSQPPGTGIVIGNLTSQFLSNIYLDQLDRFITIDLGHKAYGRYVDDFFIVLSAEELPHFQTYDVPLIEDFVTGLGLQLHPHKRFCEPIEKGVPFLGALVYPYHILPDRRVVKNYYYDLRRIVAGEKDPEVLISYMGRFQHFNAQHLQQKIWASAGLDYQLDRHGGPNSRYFTDPKDYERIRHLLS